MTKADADLITIKSKFLDVNRRRVYVDSKRKNTDSKI